MKKINKKVLAALMSATMVVSLAACSSNSSEPNKKGPSEESSASEHVGPEITDMKEGEVKETHKLSMVDYAEGEEAVNPFYKKGTNTEGHACYIVKDIDGNTMNLPLDGTVIYSMDKGEPYAELVNISYKSDGNPVSEDQWRIYVTTDKNADAGQDETPSVDSEQLTKN